MKKIAQIFKNGPDSLPDIIYMMLIKTIRSKLLFPLRYVFKYFLFGITPNVPYDLLAYFKSRNRVLTFIILYSISCGATFVTFFLWSKHIGTFEGGDPDVYYLSEDKNNLLNYTIIVPLYISTGIMLLSTILRSFGSYRMSAKSKKAGSQVSLFIVLTLCFVVSSWVTIEYINELRDPSIYTKHFWVFDTVKYNQVRVLSGMGIYYAILTFVLMFITTLFGVALFSFFKFSIDFSNKIVPENYAANEDIALIKSQLKDFITVYILAKVLAGIYILNYYTWLKQNPVDSGNLLMMKVAITIFAVVFISLPRYYIENKWYDFKLNLFFQNQIPKVEYQKILNRPQSLLISLVDIFLFGNIISDLWVEKSFVDLLLYFA